MNHGVTSMINVLPSLIMQLFNCTQCVFLNFVGAGKSSSMFGIDLVKGIRIQAAEYVFDK